MLPQRVVEELEKKSSELGTRRVLVQLPEGLKPKAREVSEELVSKGFEPIISADPCFGACDLKFENNAITLHVGHSRMLDLEPVVYWEYRYDIDPWPAIQRNLEKIDAERLGLVTTVQHIGFIDRIKANLEKEGKRVFVGPPGPRVTYPGQVLGCDASTALSIKDEVDAFLYFGSGVFHPMFVAFQTKRIVYAVDPFSGEFQTVDWDKIEKERALRISKAMNAKSFGVVLGAKPGQRFEGVAESVVKEIREAGLEAGLIEAELIQPEVLDYLGFDAYVITACPRIVLDDWKNYRKPILLPDEVHSLLAIR